MRVTFLLFDGFSNMVLSCLLEPLRAVRDQAGIDIRWQIMTADDQPVRSSSGLMVAPDPHPTPTFDVLIVVAGYGYRDHAGGGALRQLSALARHGRTVIGADTGPWLMAAAALLTGHRATLHWSLLPDFAEAFPDVQVQTAAHIRQGRIWTCGGASGAMDLMLAFIAEHFGQTNAFIASSMFLHDTDPPAEGRGGLRHLTGKGTARLRQIISLMVETIETPLSLPALASQCGLSPSKLDRMFRTQVGMPPGRYYQMLRLSHARELSTTTDLPLRDIALRCGYADAPALSKAFRKAHGRSLRGA